MEKRKPKIVVLGGGTGTYVVLSGLRDFPVDLTAVVSMADSGGSSGRLRDEFGILPPGDVRQALLALSALPLEKINLRQLFDYRFENGNARLPAPERSDGGQGLAGHSFGNLFLTALTHITGREDLAIAEAAKILDVSGQVLPVTLDHAHLGARLEDGTIIKGETNIDIRRVHPDLKILDVFLDPPAKVYPESRRAILAADLIVLGPGDLYTSLLPNLLIEGVNQALAKSAGKLVYVCNLMTKHGETDGFSVSDYVLEVRQYLGKSGKKLTKVLVNNQIGKIPQTLLRRYRQEKSFPVRIDEDNCQKLGVKLTVKPLAAVGQLLRHDSQKLAKAIMEMVK